MNTIKEYKVVESDDSYDIGDRVQEQIQLGWQPYGSMNSFVWKIAVRKRRAFKFCQPMVKYAETKKMPNGDIGEG